MKHLSHHTIAIIVALLSTLSLALAVISLPHQAYAVDGTDGTSGTNSTSQGSDGDSAPIAGPVPNIIVTNFTYGGDSVAAGADFNLDYAFFGCYPSRRGAQDRAVYVAAAGTLSRAHGG